MDKQTNLLFFTLLTASTSYSGSRTQLLHDQITRPMMRLGLLAFSTAMSGYSGLSDTAIQWCSICETLLMAPPPSSSNLTP